MAQRRSIAVVGLGAMGAAALYSLARRGIAPAGFEQFTPGHARGSSHGESRVFRLAYFEHPSYVPLARAALRAWRDIEARTGAELLRLTGIVETGHEASEVVLGSLRASREHGLAHELIDGPTVNRRYPALDVPRDFIGVTQPDAGILLPERAIDVMLSAAQGLGASVRSQTRVAALEPRAHGVRLHLCEGTPFDADAVVLAAGPWIARLAPELARVLTVTRQTLGWFEAARPDLVGPERLPVFIVDARDETLYGFPDFAGSGVKAASHLAGALVTDLDGERIVDPADVEALRAGVARYLPAAGAVSRTAACLYTRTPDEHFLIDRHPGDERIVLASPCSGHGFKFASVIGEILADLALGGDTPHDISRFSAARFG